MITLLKWVPQMLSDCSCSTLNKGFECRPRDTLLVSNRFRWLEPSSPVARRRLTSRVEDFMVLLWSSDICRREFFHHATLLVGSTHLQRAGWARILAVLFLPSPARLQSHTSVDAAAHQRQGERKLRGMSAGRAFFVACFETVFTAW